MTSSDNIASFRSRLSELPFWGWDQQSDGVHKVAAFCRQKHEQNGCEFHLKFAGSWFDVGGKRTLRYSIFLSAPLSSSVESVQKIFHKT